MTRKEDIQAAAQSIHARLHSTQSTDMQEDIYGLTDVELINSIHSLAFAILPFNLSPDAQHNLYSLRAFAEELKRRSAAGEL